MNTIKEEHILQIRATLRRERREFMITIAIALAAYLLSALLGPTGIGWIAFLVAVAASFAAVLGAVAMASWELEANLLEGPWTD